MGGGPQIVIVCTRPANGKDEILKGIPIVILVNRNTASAAEILAGALKDRQRATVIGERTYGKGTVQSLFPLKSGGAIKLTTARFYLPNGSSLEKPLNPGEDDSWGVDPSDGFDVEVSEQELDAYAAHRSAIEMFGKPNAYFRPTQTYSTTQNGGPKAAVDASKKA